MLNWGDKDSAERLAGQLRGLLRDKTMTHDQLASCYSIKHGQSVSQKLKEMSRDERPMTLGDFVAQMQEYFEVKGKNQVKGRGGAPPAAGAAPGPAAVAVAEEAAAPAVVMKYADVSRGIQAILKEQTDSIPVDLLNELFQQKFSTSVEDVVGMSTGEYLERKENIFDYNSELDTVHLQGAVLSGPPKADPAAVKDEEFVVREFEQLIESMGPVVYISTLCGKFIQRNGISVTSVISARPLDLFKRHPDRFLIVGAGNVTTKKLEGSPEVQRLLDKPSSKAQRIVKAAEEARLPVPHTLTEDHVAEEFRRLILADGTDSVYISSLCGRFLQRFKKPVTAIITCKPAEFLRKYPDIFVMTGGGNVGLREVLGPDSVSVPPPPPRVPKSLREEQLLSGEALEAVELTHQVYSDIAAQIMQRARLQAAVRLLEGVCRQVEQESFLALEEVVLGGAAGKGLPSAGSHAEIVIFVRQLPYKNFTQWLPHILETLVPVFESQLSGERAGKLKVERDHLHCQLPGGPELMGEVSVLIYISPVFKGREHLLECIRASPPTERPFFYPALVKERNELVGKQPEQVKTLIWLMTWWSQKQSWTSALAGPSDWLVELVVIHACQQPGGAADFDLAEQASRVLEIFMNFESVKVLWAETGLALYEAQDIWRPLLSHEPLFMDPLNPYSNLADASSFDSQELVAAAQRPGCYTAFKREAAHLAAAAAAEEDDEDEGADG